MYTYMLNDLVLRQLVVVAVADGVETPTVTHLPGSACTT